LGLVNQSLNKIFFWGGSTASDDELLKQINLSLWSLASQIGKVSSSMTKYYVHDKTNYLEKSNGNITKFVNELIENIKKYSIQTNKYGKDVSESSHCEPILSKIVDKFRVMGIKIGEANKWGGYPG
jgi:hypothetical protein